MVSEVLMIKDLELILAYREMLKSTVSKEIRARYKGSVLGFLWTFLNPLLQLFVYSIVFGYFLRISIPGVSFTLFLFVGIVPWTCFSSSLLMGLSVIVSNANLLKKVYFPRLILPLSSVIGNIVNLLLTLCILFPVLWLSGLPPNINYLYLVPILILQAMLNFGFTLMLSAAFVYFRDLEHLLNVALMAWMYITPIIYNPDTIPGRLFHFLKLNPMFPVVTSYQDILLFNEAPDLVALFYLAAFSLLLGLAGLTIFNRIQRRFAEEL
jgi:ABC-2 type transport system permease protein